METFPELTLENIQELFDAPPEFMFGRRDAKNLNYELVRQYKYYRSDAACILLGVTKQELRKACFGYLKLEKNVIQLPKKGPEGLKMLRQMTDDDFRSLQKLDVREAAKKIGIGMNTLKRYSRMRGIDGWARKVQIANFRAEDFVPYLNCKPMEAAKLIGCSKKTFIKYYNLNCKNKI